MNKNEEQQTITNHLNKNINLIKNNYGNQLVLDEFWYSSHFKLNINSKHISATIVGVLFLSPKEQDEFRKGFFYKYRKGNALYYLNFKNKSYELETKTLKTMKGKEFRVPVIPQFLYDYEKEQETKEKEKLKNKKLEKYTKELSISSFSGKLLLEGVTSEVTIVNNVLFIHNFGESFLRVNEKDDKFILSVSRHHSRKEYMKFGEYSEHEAILHISNLFKIGMLK